MLSDKVRQEFLKVKTIQEFNVIAKKEGFGTLGEVLSGDDELIELHKSLTSKSENEDELHGFIREAAKFYKD